MLDYLRLDGVDLHGHVSTYAAREVARVEGLIGLAQPRGESRPRVEGHGATNRSRFTGSKLVTIEGECWGLVQGDAYDTFEDVVEAVHRTLDTGPKLLTWRRSSRAAAGGVLDQQTLVIAAGSVLPPLEEGAALLRYQVVLEMLDPRAYSQTLRSIVAVVGAGITRVVAPAGLGRFPTSPLVRLIGPLAANPFYYLSVGGIEVARVQLIAPALATANDKIEVDHASKSITLVGLMADGVTVTRTLKPEYLNAPASTFFELPKGDSTVTASGYTTANAGNLSVDFRDAYSG